MAVGWLPSTRTQFLCAPNRRSLELCITYSYLKEQRCPTRRDAVERGIALFSDIIVSANNSTDTRITIRFTHDSIRSSRPMMVSDGVDSRQGKAKTRLGKTAVKRAEAQNVVQPYGKASLSGTP